ncbi:Hypothetical protein D9617_1g083060 [Elsinoe fawcettii]|nr:Hypothetical protein D9617_1g083060 [Elsinoe fawcettii]
MFPLLQPNRPNVEKFGGSVAVKQQPSLTYLPPRPSSIEHTGGFRSEATPCKSEPKQGPPRQTAMAAPHAPSMPGMQFNSAIRHPVFFTSQLQRPPFPTPPFRPEYVNPAATGYILNSANAAPKPGSPRL